MTTNAAVMSTAVVEQVAGSFTCSWTGEYRDEYQDLKDLRPYSGGQFIDQLHSGYIYYIRGDGTIVSVKSSHEGHMSSDCSSISWSNGDIWYRLTAVESTTTNAAVMSPIVVEQVSGSFTCSWAGEYRDQNEDLKELIAYSGGQFVDQLHPGYNYYTKGDNTLVSVKSHTEGHMSSDCSKISWSNGVWYRLTAVESTTTNAAVVSPTVVEQVSGSFTCSWAGEYRDQNE